MKIAAWFLFNFWLLLFSAWAMSRWGLDTDTKGVLIVGFTIPYAILFWYVAGRLAGVFEGKPKEDAFFEKLEGQMKGDQT